MMLTLLYVGLDSTGQHRGVRRQARNDQALLV